MYLIERDADLGPEYLAKCLLKFQTTELPKLNKWWKYFKGQQKILQKQVPEGYPNNRVVTNYCYNIVENYRGYLTGKPITYDNEDFQEILDVLNYNDVQTEDSEYLKNALIFGRAFECNYIDEEGQQRFRLFDSRQCVPIYENSLANELLYVVRFYREDLLDKANENYIVEVYGPNSVKYYRTSMVYVSFEFIREEFHYFGQCPVTVFKLNEEEESIFNQVMSLQDAYNQMLSDEIDSMDNFNNAYLVLKGLTADEEQLSEMKSNRVLIMDTDASAEFLTKDIKDTQIINTLQNYNDQIYKISGCPDFTSDKLLAQSGIALRYKLVGFENKAANIEQCMRKAIQRRLELIAAIFSLTDDEPWQDVDINFTRNLPISLEPSTPDELMKYKGTVSDRTLLSLIPFVKNVDDEMAEIEIEKQANMELFRSNITENEDE